MLGTRRAQRIAVIGLSLATCGAILVATAGYFLHIEPAFYEQAGGFVSAEGQTAARGFLRESTKLFNAIENDAEWSASFRASELNAWLTHEFPKKHRELLPSGVRHPRVAFERDCMRIGFRAAIGPIETVVSVTGRVWVPEPNRLAIEFDQVRGGVVPLPMSWLVGRVNQVMHSAQVPVEWKRHRGKKVALVRLGDPRESALVELLRAEVGETVLFVAGRSRNRASDQVARDESASNATRTEPESSVVR